MKHIRIGTRGSKLALWQANHVAALLLKNGWNTQIVTIETKGDKILDVSISKIGSKGVFTEEIEEQLRSGAIDIAVHSAKDLQSSLPDDLHIIAATEREEASDVLIAPASIDLEKPLRIGTSSTRRVAFVKKYYPPFTATPVRGNLQTRISKMQQGDCDALLLAEAGVIRMGYQELIRYKFPKTEFIPPVGQGIVAIEASKSLNPLIYKALRDFVNHDKAEQCLILEREYLRELDGGCSIPAFCHAEINQDKVQLTGGIMSLDGKEYLEEKIEVNLEKASGEGTGLAKKILSQGGSKILSDIRKQL